MAEGSQELMDAFAAEAMHAILSNEAVLEAVTKMGTQALAHDDALTAIAARSYDLATAMMVERARRRKLEPEFKLGGPGRKA